MTPLLSVIYFLLILAFFIASRTFRDYQKRGGLLYPPGPRPLPVIGNLLDIPRESSWFAYTQLAKKYGDIMSFHVLGRVIVILGSAKTAKDLLEKRGSTYSDRPVIPFFEMMELQWALPFASYGADFRLRRKIAERCFRTASLAQYRSMQESRARVLVTRMLKNPQEWEAHIELFQGEQLLAMTYGYEIKSLDDRILDIARKQADFVSRASLPGSFLVNEFPFLRHVPEWLPWFSYKPLARVGYALAEELKNDPMQFVRENMLNGSAHHSMAFERLVEAEQLSGSEREAHEKAIAETLGVMYTAGIDTLMSTMMSFLLAMLLFPELQRKAQDEIDDVTGRARFPTFEDRPRLPFVDALCKEVFRWAPASPLHIPHMATEDRVYEGFFIPKGSLLIGNIWAILHDPDVYPEPEVFNPERFLNSDGTLRDDPTLTAVFGFGKRICPGRHLADATLFIFAATVLSALHIEKQRDPGGGPFEYTYSGGLVSRPNAFPCSITPRDKIAEEIIMGADTTRELEMLR